MFNLQRRTTASGRAALGYSLGMPPGEKGLIEPAGEWRAHGMKPYTRGGEHVGVLTQRAIRCLCTCACLLALLGIHQSEGATFNYSGQLTSSTYNRVIPPGGQTPTDCATPTTLSGFGNAVRYQAQKIRVDATGTYTIETTSASSNRGGELHRQRFHRGLQSHLQPRQHADQYQIRQ